jgi:integrase/recombinase XerD
LRDSGIVLGSLLDDDLGEDGMATVYRRGDVWWVRFRMGGVHVRRSAKTSKKNEAQAFLAKLMEEHAQAARASPAPTD